MEDVLHLPHGIDLPLREIQVRASRSSGPGGQHANVTASRVEASFDVAASEALGEEQKARVMARCGPVVRAVAQDARSQARNRTLALARLQARLAHALEVPRPRRATRPTAASKARRLEAKRRAGGAQARAAAAGGLGRGLGPARPLAHSAHHAVQEVVAEDGGRWGADGHRPPRLLAPRRWSRAPRGSTQAFATSPSGGGP
jgi:ribosome-associated protein